MTKIVCKYHILRNFLTPASRSFCKPELLYLQRFVLFWRVSIQPWRKATLTEIMKRKRNKKINRTKERYVSSRKTQCRILQTSKYNQLINYSSIDQKINEDLMKITQRKHWTCLRPLLTVLDPYLFYMDPYHPDMDLYHPDMDPYREYPDTVSVDFITVITFFIFLKMEIFF